MESILRMYRHLGWADTHILSMLKGLPQDDPQVRRLYSHVLLAEQIWLARLHQKDSTHLPVWDMLELAACEQLAQQNQEHYAELLSQLDEQNLDVLLTYKKSKNEQFETSIRDILIHVALHGQYHRGQINACIRAGGFDPVNVDYITYVR